MKMINKNYFRYLIRQNKRYLLLIWLISFILTPFLTINFLNNGNGENFGQIVVITSMFGFLISFVVPIYLFTFLQKKKSNILYFSLPIKKESLFITTSCFAIFSTIVPVIVNYLIAIMIKNFFLPASLGSQLFSVILMIIYMLCMESVITVIVLLCQNLLDSYLVSLAYMLVPFLIYGCFKLFLSTLGNNFMLGSGNYTEVFNPMLDYISFIYNGFLQIAYCMDNTVMISATSTDGAPIVYGAGEDDGDIILLTYQTTRARFIPVSINPQEGTVEKLEKIVIDMGEYLSWLDYSKEISVTDQAGNEYSCTFDFSWDNFNWVEINLDEPITAEGIYTLVVPEGLVFNDSYDFGYEDSFGNPVGDFYNPELVYKFTIGNPDSIENVAADANRIVKAYTVSGICVGEGTMAELNKKRPWRKRHGLFPFQKTSEHEKVILYFDGCAGRRVASFGATI